MASVLAVMSVAGPYLFQTNGDVSNGARNRPRHVSFVQLDMEAICFVPEGLLATTESRRVLLFREQDFADVAETLGFPSLRNWLPTSRPAR